MKGKTLLYFLFLLFCSCATRKLQIPTTAVDMNTGVRIKENSIQFDRGKICYLYATQYDKWLFDRSVFKNTQTASFYSGSSSTHSIYHGAAFRSSKVDTVVNNDLVVQIALNEALKNCPLGFQFHYVPQRQFTDTTGKLNTLLVREKFDPDIIINLTSLSVKMTGDAHSGMTDVEVKPGIVNYCCYSYTTGVSSNYGNILMDYTAVWEIQNLRENTMRSIRQEGRYVSMYYKDYSMNEEMMICAQKIGREFSSLFKDTYYHIKK